MFSRGEDVIPFSVCKRKYKPYADDDPERKHLRYACNLHEGKRRKRLEREGFGVR